MPTSYTDDLKKPETTFEDFAKHCARAMGAFIMVRDEPYDGTMPRSEVSDYHAKYIDSLEVEAANLEKMTLSEAFEKASTEFEEMRTRALDNISEKMVLKVRYERMLEKAKAYMPPTSDHNEYKKFMIEQLEKSIQGDCTITYSMDDIKSGKYKPLSGETWLKNKKARIAQQLERHHEKLREEISRTADRNAWIDKLEESL